MTKAPLPPTEVERLASLHRYQILDTLPERTFDDITRLASEICGTPISLISLVDEQRQWFKSKFGLDATETSRDLAFCAHAILQDDVMVIPNALEDVRFADNPLVTSDPHIRFYAGAPLITANKLKLGTLCAIDRVARQLTPEQAESLRALSRLVVSQMELRMRFLELEVSVAQRDRAEAVARDDAAQVRAIVETAVDGIITVDAHGTVQSMNGSCERIFGYPAKEVTGRNVKMLMPPPYHDQHDGYLAHYLQTGEKKVIGIGREVMGRRRDGSVFPMDLSVGEVQSGGGRLFTGIVRDITERKRMEALRAEQLNLASFGAAVGVALTNTSTMQDMLQECCEAMVHHLDAAFGRIWTLNEPESTLELQASAGLYTHIDGPHGRVPVGKFKIGLIAEEREPHLTNDVLHDPRVGDRAWAREQGMVSFAGHPLMIKGRVLGVMAMFARRPLSEFVLKALVSTADGIALGIQRMRVEEALNDAKDATERLLLNILPEVVVNRLTSGQSPIADYCAEATIMFADLHDFSRLTQGMAAADVVKLLSGLYSRFDALIEKLGLEKIKTIGDAYMVAAGVPVPRADHAEAVAEAALALQQEIVRHEAPNGETFSLRIGINTGPVVAGVIGTSKFSYDLWGETVNTAWQMEAYGTCGCIQVNESTYARLRDKYLFEDRGEFYVKGKGEVRTYFLKGRKPGP